MKSHPIKGLRHFVRIPFGADVLLTLNGQTMKVHLLDISLKGALVQCDSDHVFALRDTCQLKLPMAEDGEGIVMSGRIVHVKGPLIGLESSSIDLTSLTRLRRLIELNSGDPELMNREIRQLIADH
jgi:hypothetical protein